MADVSVERPSTPSSRGQLFIVTAITLAVLFVALALLLNTAIYTENLATRSEDGDLRAARELRVAADEDVAHLVRYVNYRNNTTYAELDAALVAGVEDWSEAAGIHGARAGRGVNVSRHSLIEGTRIVQHDVGSFEDILGNRDWTLASDVRSRDLYLNVSQLSLDDGAALGDDPTDYAQSSLFRVVHDDGSTTWSTYLYRDGGGNVVVRTLVDDGSKSLLPACVRAPDPRGYVAIDFERGLAGGTDCASLAFDPSGDHAVRYRNATDGGDPNVAGTYEVVVNEDEASYDVTESVFDEVGGQPYSTPAIYAARVTVAFETAAVDYRTTVTANPAHVDRRYGVAGAGRPAVVGGGGAGGGGGEGGASGEYAPNGSVESVSPDSVSGNEYDVQISYTVDDGNDDMTSVELVLRDPDDNVEDVVTVDLESHTSPHSGTVTFENVKITGKHTNAEWTVELTVFDSTGLTGTDSNTETLP